MRVKSWGMGLCPAIAGLMLIGCASDDHRHTSDYYYDRGNHPDVVVERKDGSTVTIDGDSDRVYVRERDAGYHHESQMMPRHRGKHPDGLGWNDPEYYRR